jgi:hypothetical protein
VAAWPGICGRCGGCRGTRNRGQLTGPAPIRPPPWVVHGPYSPSIDPANFVDRIDNRDFPLEPGTGFHYAGFAGRTPQRDDMIVTHRTKMILGVRCTVVRDTVSEHGKAVERTFD